MQILFLLSEKLPADTQFSRCSTAKFSGVRVQTKYEQTAAFSVLAAMRSPLQTINQIAYSAALNPARGNIWLPPSRFELRLIAVFEGHNRNLHTSGCCQFLLPPFLLHPAPFASICGKWNPRNPVGLHPMALNGVMP
jgi:hypothetical protein